MRILAIDTASKVCGVALLENDIVIGAKELNNGRTHSENLMPLIDELLKENKIEKSTINLIAVNIGPRFFYWNSNRC